jgi:hypothetical protein
VNTEMARVKISGRRDGGDERGVKPARDRDLPRYSVEILRDLGLSKEKIVAYHRRFPTPTPNNGSRPAAMGRASAITPSARKVLIRRFTVLP